MAALITTAMTVHQDQAITEAVEQQRSRLRNFIRQRVTDPDDVEDILQDAFSELVEAYRLMKPVREAGAWLFQVARNRIIDRFRKKRTEAISDVSVPAEEDDETLTIEDLLPSSDGGPEAAYWRSVLLEELAQAMAELPEDQRAVFIAQEIQGRSFAELAAESGLSINTLLSRKRYAVLHLRRRLQAIYDELRKF
jgi:RNA polymerase sigma factor (sigma-70 family)